MGPEGVPQFLWATREVAGAGVRDDMEGVTEGAFWICFAPAAFKGRDRWSALEIVGSLVDDALVTCLGWLCVVNDVEGVVVLLVLDTGGAGSGGRPT